MGTIGEHTRNFMLELFIAVLNRLRVDDCCQNVLVDEAVCARSLLWLITRFENHDKAEIKD